MTQDSAASPSPLYNVCLIIALQSEIKLISLKTDNYDGIMKDGRVNNGSSERCVHVHGQKVECSDERLLTHKKLTPV